SQLPRDLPPEGNPFPAPGEPRARGPEGGGGERQRAEGAHPPATHARLSRACWAVLSPGLRPSRHRQVENVLKMLKGRNGPLVDIGSGDGRIVIAAAKVGFKAVGYELNPWLVWYSRYCAWREGVHQDTKFYISDLWKVREHLQLISDASKMVRVLCGFVPLQMLQLEKKLGEELASDARVIACRFPFPHWRPKHSFGEGIDAVWAYDSESFGMKEENDFIKTNIMLR
uniref:ATP synthase c subunit lysine N-methyltransferase n=1 Tax=Podarcis muralis TaxID=64176 RepID=A0A670K0I0_PODMU